MTIQQLLILNPKCPANSADLSRTPKIGEKQVATKQKGKASKEKIAQQMLYQVPTRDFYLNDLSLNDVLTIEGKGHAASCIISNVEN